MTHWLTLLRTASHAMVPASLARPPWVAQALAAQSPEDWQEQLQALDRYGLIPAYHIGLEAHGLADHAPDDVREALWATWRLNTDRNARLIEQARAISTALAAIDCPVVYLKGMGHILDNTHPAGARMSNDIDVVVPKDRLIDASRALRAIGYEFDALPVDQAEAKAFEKHHIEALIPDGKGAAVELHHCFLGHRPDWAPLRQLCAQAQPSMRAPDCLVPPPVLAASAAIAHSALRPRLTWGRGFHVRDALDLAALVAGGRVDLAEVQALFDRYGDGIASGWFVWFCQWICGFDPEDFGLRLRPLHRARGQAELFALRARPGLSRFFPARQA